MLSPEPSVMVDRFIDKIAVMPNGCWQWTGGTRRSGYGAFWLLAPIRKLVCAHRAAYEIFVGPIPGGLQIDHLCRNTGCVNPGHLEPVTARTNVLRGDTITARWSRQTHCVHGHAFDEENTLVTARGHRRCRACARADYYRRKDAARLREGKA